MNNTAISSFVVVVLLLLLLVVVSGTNAKTASQHITFPEANTVKGPDLNERIGIENAIQHKLFPEGVGAVQSIANRVLKILDEDTVRTSPKNWVISPLSLTAVIAQLLLASRGLLQTTLTDTLSLKKGVKPASRLDIHRQLGQLMKYLERSGNESYTLDINSAVFIQSGIGLKSAFKHALSDFYHAMICTVDFQRRSEESTKRINDWVKESTHGKLPVFFTHPLPQSTCSIMANVVYFNGRWDNPFDPNFTTTGTFHVNENKKVKTEFMYTEKELLYKNTSTFQLIGIPYKNWEVVLYIVLPHERPARSLNLSRVDDLVASGAKENFTIFMPKLKLFSAISVRDSVLKYLMRSETHATRSIIVSEKSKGLQKKSIASRGSLAIPGESSLDDGDKFDVGGASEDEYFKINDVIHQVSLEVDEKGSEIAAVTGTLIDYSAPAFTVKIDHPFWFFVRHELSLTHLFWGRIVDPSVERN